MAASNVPVRESVGAALRFVRENLRFIATISVLGAAAMTVIAVLASLVPQIGLITSLASTVLQAFVYAAFTGAVLFGAAAVRGRVTVDGGRVWAAMAIIGFFMTIVMMVISIPVIIVLVSGPLAQYAVDLQEAGGNQLAVMSVMTRFMEENPGAVLLTALFYVVIWFLLTSRLYLAAPATVDQARILTFETWKWTKGAMFRILAARLMLLGPAYVLMFALTYLAGYGLGVDPTNLAAMSALAAANPVAFSLYVAVSSFVTFLVYNALEAGLSAHLYRGLKPADAAQVLPPTS